jgi:glycosyltransferase involved in cell wall biosynthesis
MAFVSRENTGGQRIAFTLARSFRHYHPPQSVSQPPKKIVWISDFPLEWLSELPEALRSMPRRHPATWMIALMSEFEKNPDVRLHVVLLRHRMPGNVQFERNGTTFHVLKAKPFARLASLFWLDTILIRKVCRSIQPDIVHAWGNEKGAALIADRMGFPYLMTIQGLYRWYKEIVPLSRYEKLMCRFEDASLKRAPLVTAESNFTANYIRDRYPNTKVIQAEHAPNWIFSQVQRCPTKKPLAFIFIGTLGYRKGTDLLFKALDHLKAELDFRLKVITNHDAQKLAQIRSSSSPSLWNKTQFQHDVLPNEVAAQLAVPTMLLMPTRADTGPVAVKEATVAGVPVVASDIGGIPDYIVPGKNGVLFRSGDLDGFVAAIREAVQHPLFSEGLVDPQTLAEKRQYLSASQMGTNFLNAYTAASSAWAERLKNR